MASLRVRAAFASGFGVPRRLEAGGNHGLRRTAVNHEIERRSQERPRGKDKEKFAVSTTIVFALLSDGRQLRSL